MIDRMDDVALLRSRIVALAFLSDRAIAALWRTWSDAEWCAGWVDLTGPRISEFAKWVSE